MVFIGMFSIYYFKKQVSDKEKQNEKEKGKEMMLNSSDEENHSYIITNIILFILI